MFNIFKKLENPKRPLLGPNVKALRFWGLLLPKNIYMKYFYLLMHLLVTVFTATEYVDIWFIKTDLNLLLNNLKITMLATMSVIKVTTFLYWQTHWKNIIEYVTRADLGQRATIDIKKNNLITKFTTYCRKITFFYWSLMYTTVVIVIFQPILKYFLSQTYRENVANGTESYLQVVSSWVPFDKSTIPGYLSASIFQSYAAIYGGGWITSFDTNAMVIMVFFRAELEMLRIDCANIYGTERNPVSDFVALKRLKECHLRHVELVKYTVQTQSKEFTEGPLPPSSEIIIINVRLTIGLLILALYSRLFDSCLSPIMLLYMFVCSVMLCVTAFQITSETSAMQQFLTTEYLVFGIAQLFIYCWHSNDVYYASLQLSQGPYESIWWCKKGSHRKNLFILTGQLSKVVVFSAGPFTKLTVATFISILKGAYSYYTLLSKSQAK